MVDDETYMMDNICLGFPAVYVAEKLRIMADAIDKIPPMTKLKKIVKKNARVRDGETYKDTVDIAFVFDIPYKDVKK